MRVYVIQSYLSRSDRKETENEEIPSEMMKNDQSLLDLADLLIWLGFS